MKRIGLLLVLIACMSVAGIATTLKRGPVDDVLVLSLVFPAAAAAIVPPAGRSWEISSGACFNTSSGASTATEFSLFAADATQQGSSDTPSGNTFDQNVTEAMVFPDDGDMGTWNQRIPKGGSLGMSGPGGGIVVYCTFELIDVS